MFRYRNMWRRLAAILFLAIKSGTASSNASSNASRNCDTVGSTHQIGLCNNIPMHQAVNHIHCSNNTNPEFIVCQRMETCINSQIVPGVEHCTSDTTKLQSIIWPTSNTFAYNSLPFHSTNGWTRTGICTNGQNIRISMKNKDITYDNSGICMHRNLQGAVSTVPTVAPSTIVRPSASATVTRSRLASISASATRLGSVSGTATRLGSISATATRRGSISATATRTRRGSISGTATRTRLGSVSGTATRTRLGSISATATRTRLGSISGTATRSRFGSISVTATRSRLGSISATATRTRLGSISATATRSRFASSSVTATRTRLGSVSVSATRTRLGSVSGTATRSRLGSVSGSATRRAIISSSSSTATRGAGVSSSSTIIRSVTATRSAAVTATRSIGVSSSSTANRSAGVSSSSTTIRSVTASRSAGVTATRSIGVSSSSTASRSAGVTAIRSTGVSSSSTASRSAGVTAVISSSTASRSAGVTATRSIGVSSSSTASRSAGVTATRSAEVTVAAATASRSAEVTVAAGATASTRDTTVTRTATTSSSASEQVTNTRSATSTSTVSASLSTATPTPTSSNKLYYSTYVFAVTNPNLATFGTVGDISIITNDIKADIPYYMNVVVSTSNNQCGTTYMSSAARYNYYVCLTGPQPFNYIPSTLVANAAQGVQPAVTPTPTSDNSTVIIVGALIGGMVALGIATLITVHLRRRSKHTVKLAEFNFNRNMDAQRSITINPINRSHQDAEAPPPPPEDDIQAKTPISLFGIRTHSSPLLSTAPPLVVPPPPPPPIALGKERATFDPVKYAATNRSARSVSDAKPHRLLTARPINIVQEGKEELNTRKASLSVDSAPPEVTPQEPILLGSVAQRKAELVRKLSLREFKPTVARRIGSSTMPTFAVTFAPTPPSQPPV